MFYILYPLALTLFFLMRYIFTALFIACLWLTPTALHAQSIVWDDEQDVLRPVDQRLPEELRQEPLIYNGFEYKTSLTVGGRYDDNILASANKSSDYILTLTPKLQINKNYKAHRFTLGAQSTIERFADRDQENKEDISLFARALLFAKHKWEVPLFISFDQKARLRDKPQAFLSDKPLDINKTKIQGGITRNLNRLSLSLLGEYERYSNDDGRASSAPATPAIFSDNDRDIYRGKLKARYDISQGAPGDETAPSHILFADFVYGRQYYDRNKFTNGSFSGPSGNRDELGFLAGLESRYKGLLFSRVGVGYLRQRFDDSTLSDISAINLTADIAYSITPKLTLGLKASRDIDQDNGFTQGTTESSVVFTSDYELKHNLYLNADLGHTDYKFEGLARDDEERMAKLGLTYHNSQRLETSLGLHWQDRDSTIAANDFNRLVLLLNITSKL